MAEYTVRNKKNGQTITFRWNKDTPPTQADMQRVFDAAESQSTPNDQQQRTGNKLAPPLKSVAEKPGYLQRFGEYYTKDIPETIKGAVGRTVENYRGIDKPTLAGNVAKKALGGEGMLANVGERVAGTPERTLRTLGTVGNAYGELYGMIGDLGSKSLRNWTGGKVDIGKVTKKIGESAPVRTVANLIDKLPEEVKEDVKGVMGVIELAGIKKSESMIDPVKRAVKKAENLEKSISLGVDKGIKPTVRNKSNFSKMKQFEKKANQAVKTIAENKNKINLVDEFGESIPYPKNAADFAQAIEKNKKYIYKQYHQMATQAGGTGIVFDSNKIVRKLDDISNSKKYNPKIRQYALEVKDEIDELAGASPEIIEERIKDLNSSLNSFYEGRISKAKAQVDASVANLMREELDNNITSAIGTGYSDLKRQYGALKAIEKEVNHRAIVNARRASKGVADLTDIFTGGDLIAGVVAMNPALIARGIAGRGIKEGIKAVNNPDRYIKNMFKKAYQFEDLKGKNPTYRNLKSVVR